MCRRYWAKKEMTRGPNKVILSQDDLIFILKKDMNKGSKVRDMFKVKDTGENEEIDKVRVKERQNIKKTDREREKCIHPFT